MTILIDFSSSNDLHTFKTETYKKTVREEIRVGLYLFVNIEVK